jgi:hypothetical protein
MDLKIFKKDIPNYPKFFQNNGHKKRFFRLLDRAIADQQQSMMI